MAEGSVAGHAGLRLEGEDLGLCKVLEALDQAETGGHAVADDEDVIAVGLERIRLVERVVAVRRDLLAVRPDVAAGVEDEQGTTDVPGPAHRGGDGPRDAFAAVRDECVVQAVRAGHEDVALAGHVPPDVVHVQVVEDLPRLSALRLPDEPVGRVDEDSCLERQLTLPDRALDRGRGVPDVHIPVAVGLVRHEAETGRTSGGCIPHATTDRLADDAGGHRSVRVEQCGDHGRGQHPVHVGPGAVEGIDEQGVVPAPRLSTLFALEAHTIDVTELAAKDGLAGLVRVRDQRAVVALHLRATHDPEELRPSYTRHRERDAALHLFEDVLDIDTVHDGLSPLPPSQRGICCLSFSYHTKTKKSIIFPPKNKSKRID